MNTFNKMIVAGLIASTMAVGTSNAMDMATVWNVGPTALFVATTAVNVIGPKAVMSTLKNGWTTTKAAGNAMLTGAYNTCAPIVHGIIYTAKQCGPFAKIGLTGLATLAVARGALTAIPYVTPYIGKNAINTAMLFATAIQIGYMNRHTEKKGTGVFTNPFSK